MRQRRRVRGCACARADRRGVLRGWSASAEIAGPHSERAQRPCHSERAQPLLSFRASAAPTVIPSERSESRNPHFARSRSLRNVFPRRGAEERRGAETHSSSRALCTGAPLLSTHDSKARTLGSAFSRSQRRGLARSSACSKCHSARLCVNRFAPRTRALTVVSARPSCAARSASCSRSQWSDRRRGRAVRPRTRR